MTATGGWLHYAIGCLLQNGWVLNGGGSVVNIHKYDTIEYIIAKYDVLVS